MHQGNALMVFGKVITNKNYLFMNNKKNLFFFKFKIKICPNAQITESFVLPTGNI